MYFQVMRQGQTYGPYTLEDIQRYVVTGNILPTDLAKSEEMADWMPIAQLLDTRAAPPPVPGAPLAAAGFSRPMFEQNDPALGGRHGSYPFFPISTSKFVVMSLVTFGLYNVYWAYKQWDRIAGRTGESMMPWARALFLGIWNFVLFERIKVHAVGEGISVRWNPVLLGIAVLVFAITSRLPGAWSAIVFLSFLAYVPVLGTVREINRRHAEGVDEPDNTRYSGWNIAGIVCGGLVLGLALLGFAAEATHLVPATR